jgi:hypothetical protein
MKIQLRRLSGGRPSPPPLLRLGVRRFQIADQALKGFLIRAVILPVAEVRNEILANLASRILTGVTVEALPIAQGFERRKQDGEQNAPLVTHLALPGLGDFRLHPLTLHAVGRQDQEQLVMETNGLFDLFVKFLAALDVVRGKPAAHTFVLQVGVEAVGEVLVFSGVAYEAGIELDGIGDE